MKKSMIYKRLFLIYMSIITILLGVLDVFFIDKVKRNIVQNNIYINEKVVYDVNEELVKIVNSTDLISNIMYTDLFVLNDIISFLSTDLVNYSKNKLDKFYNSSDNFYRGIEFFTMNSFSSNDNLDSIAFVSYKGFSVRTFNRKNQIYEEELPQYLNQNSNKLLDIYFDKNSIKFVKKIRDSNNLEEIGAMVLTYNLDKVNKIIEKYNDKHQILILDLKGNIVYTSEGNYEYKKYMYLDELKKNKDILYLGDKYYVSRKHSDAGVLILSKFKINSIKIPKQYINSLLCVDLVLLMISIGIVQYKIIKLSDRTDEILFAMESVKNGNLNVHIPIKVDDENDEIKYISENFNTMCIELNENIEKSYRAELNQKKAEMVALQNQINPHFLYNTLEGIRMKAVCNGDREVSKMLYNLAFLFRKQVKDSNIILLKDELDYCVKYIEIFKFRYEDRFDFKINYDEDVLENKIVKFTLQPIIENYFVHGIRLDRYDNFLEIDIKKYNKDIFIYIKNNGNKISCEKIKDLNNSFKNRKYSGKSIGLSNANERIIIEYGQQYGIEFKEITGEEVVVVVKLPFREE